MVSSDAQRSTREWLQTAHATLEKSLPRGRPPALLTDDLTDDAGDAIDVLAHFGRNPRQLSSLWCNLTGIAHTAQASGADSEPGSEPPDWPEFEDIWIPIHEGLQLAARIGFAERDGERLLADCIVILPGLFGDLSALRMRDIALALRDSGRHVVALETRGFGQTGDRYPNIYYTFGALAIGDVLAVAEWLQGKPEIHETGLIGFCWSANTVLLAAWETSRRDNHLSVTDRLKPHLRGPWSGRLLRAGVLAFSPVLRFEEIVQSCERPWSILEDPVLDTLQDGIKKRMERQGYAEISGRLRDLIQFEFDRSELSYPRAVEDSLRLLRLLPHRGKPAGDKLRDANVPVLIVQGADDPLTSAQNVADLLAGLDNPNVAALVLPGGGHVGFAPFARSYFYSLILNFFDPERGAAAVRGGIATDGSENR